MLKNSYKKGFVSVLLLCMIVGVSYSYPMTFEKQNDPAHKVDARQILNHALETNQNSVLAQQFWFKGWVKNYVQKRKTTSMFSGIMISPHGYYVDARMAAVPYRYYKWDEHNYIWTADTEWSRLEQEQIQFAPFAGFDWWLPFLDTAQQLPNEEILSKNTLVFEVTVNGKDWVEKSGSPIFVDLQDLISSTPGMDDLLQKSYVKMTLWIGDEVFSYADLVALAEKKGIATNDEAAIKAWIEDNRFILDEEKNAYHQHLIYQYHTLIHFPILGAGYMDQETFFQLYSYDDPSIKMKTPAEMEQYILKQEQHK